MTITLGYKNVALTILFLERTIRVKTAVSVKEKQGDEDRWRTAILTPIFFLALLCRIQGPTWHFLCFLPGWGTTHLWVLTGQYPCLCVSVTAHDCVTAHYTCGCLHIWFHNAYLFPVDKPCDLLPAVNSYELLIPTHGNLPVYTAGTWQLCQDQYTTHILIQHVSYYTIKTLYICYHTLLWHIFL